MASQFAPEPPAGLLERAVVGDDTAFAELYRLYGSPVFTVALRMLAQREAAEEVLQEVFIELLRALDGYRGDGAFWTWLRRLTVSKALMRIRSERARPVLVGWDGAMDEHPAGGWADESAGGAFDRAMLARDLEAALAELPAVSRAVVWLHDVEGWTHQEIAVAMDRTPSFSKSQLARAHLKLRVLLENRSVTTEGVVHDASDDRAAPRPA